MGAMSCKVKVRAEILNGHADQLHIPEFHDCPCYNILIPWLHNGGAISLFSRW